MILTKIYTEAKATTKLALTPFDGVSQQKPDAKISFNVLVP